MGGMGGVGMYSLKGIILAGICNWGALWNRAMHNGEHDAGDIGALPLGEERTYRSGIDKGLFPFPLMTRWL